MIARALFRLHPAHLHAPSRPTSNSFISPTYARFTRNSFVSPTYAKTGGCTPLKMSARRHFLSLPPNFRSRLSFFSIVCALSPQKTRGTPPLVIHTAPERIRRAKPARLGRRPLQRSSSTSCQSPITCHQPLFTGLRSLATCHSLHSPPIHNSVTAPSPIVLSVLSQWTPVRGPTHTPCLPSTRGLRYTSTDAIRPARSAHEARTDY